MIAVKKDAEILLQCIFMYHKKLLESSNYLNDSSNPARIYWFKVNKENTRAVREMAKITLIMREICLMLALKTAEGRLNGDFAGVSVVEFEPVNGGWEVALTAIVDSSIIES